MKKIMFSDKYGLTEAVLQGRKTMTRRIVTDYKFNQWEGRQIILGYDPDSNTQQYGLLSDDGSGEIIDTRLLKYPCRCGDVFAVAQSYKSIHEEMMNGDYGNGRYDAFRCAMVAGTKAWGNKMFVRADLMPHQIRITDIKVERLQDISEEDCLKEGLIKRMDGFIPEEYFYTYCGADVDFAYIKTAFADLIDKVSGKGSWESNPWVFAYSFELCK